MKTGNGIFLTARERLILRFVGKGCTNKEIANAIHISVETVKKHLQNIYRKLEAGNKIEALRRSGMI